MYPPLTAPPVPSHRPVSSAPNTPGESGPGELGVRVERVLAQGRVRISCPSSVTRMVCSNWAVRLRSLVTAVQPSGQTS